MAIKEILKVPNEILTTRCKDANYDSETKILAENLIDTLESATNPKGAGLAAPQIGVMTRICVAKRFTPDPNDSEKEIDSNFILINPEILSHSESKDLWWEGCLSIPNTYGRVERFKRIKVKSYDLEGKEFTLKADGFFARVIQHEIDHLNGILFTTKIVGEILTEKELEILLDKAK